MKAPKKGGEKNGSVSMTLSWDNELTLTFNGVGNGIVEPEWKTSFEQPYDGYVGEKFVTKSKLKFYNPTPQKPMNGSMFLSFLDLGRIKNILQGNYNNIKHFHYPIEAMIKIKIYQRLMQIKARTALEPKLKEKGSLIPQYLGFKKDMDGKYLIPDETTILHFIERRLKMEGLQEIEDEMVRMLNEECMKQGIQLGRRIGIDSTPLEALPKDEMADYNGHYEMNMWKIHEITCLDTHISLSQELSFGNDFDGNYLIPMLQRLKDLGIRFEEVMGDHHYNTLENWAKVNVILNCKAYFGIGKGDRIRKDGTEKEIQKQYQKFWNKEGFIPTADLDYMMRYLVAHGVFDCVGAYFRNKWMQYNIDYPKKAKKIFNERTDVERLHSHFKNAMKLEQNLNVKGIDRVEIYVKEFWIAQLAIALTRLQNRVTEGLTNCGKRTFL